MKPLLLIILIFVFFFNIEVGYSSTPITIDDSFKSEMLINFFEFYYDKDGELKKDGTTPTNGQFSKYITAHAGYFSESVWAKFEVKYNLKKDNKYIINFDNHMLSEIILYQVDGNRLKKIDETGELINIVRTGRDFELQLSLPKLQGHIQYYIRAKGPDLVNLNSIIRSESAHDKFKEDNGLIVGLYYGCLMTIIIIAYFFYYRFKDMKGGIYIHFFSVLVLISTIVDGTASYLFPLHYIGGVGGLIPFFLTIATVLAIKATTDLFLIKSRKMVYAGNIIIAISVIASIISLFSFGTIGHMIANLNVGIAVVYILIFSYERLRNHEPFSKHLLIVWGIYLFIQMFYFLSIYSYLNYSFPPAYIYMFSTLHIAIGICFIFFESISERYEKAGRVSHTKMTETMIAGVAHELNNPLTIVVGNIDLMQMRLNKLEINDELLIKYLERQVLGVKRVCSFIEEIKSLTGQSNCHVEYTYINRLIEDVVEESRADFNNVHVKIDLPTTVNIKVLSSNDIKNVFSELLDNGIDAVMKNKDKKRVIIESYTEKDFVVIVIQDNGKGMSKEEIYKAFNYFYTTKPPSKKAGQGLGLPVAENVISSIGGSVRILSKEEEWTRLIVKLPIAKTIKKAA